MIEFLQENWGDLVSVLGVLVSLGGLAWAILEARKAKFAAVDAAEAADRGAAETRERIARSFGVADLASAIALIQRLKLLHREERWEAALEQYQTLRAMISDILSRYPEWDGRTRTELAESRDQLTIMERHVEGALRKEGLTLEASTTLNDELNHIQSTLEDRASEVGFDNS